MQLIVVWYFAGRGVDVLCIDVIIVLTPLMECLAQNVNAGIVLVANQNIHTQHAICRAHNSWCFVLYFPSV